MYEVSKAYKEAMKGRVQHTDIAGTVGDEVFTRENILQGSLSITNQCAGATDMELGCVYIGEMQCTFMNMDIPRNSWAGRKIRPVYKLLTEKGWEEVPLGVYTVEEANWTRQGIQVTAYDNMAKLDTTAQFAVSTGKAYDFLQAICAACHIELGMDKETVESFPNGKITMGIYSDNDIDTWRDMLSYLAAAMGAYATMDRTGKLVLRTFSDTPVDDLDDAHRFKNETFSDFSTKYSGVYITDKDSGDNIYYGGTGEGLVMHLGANPFIQYGVEETLEMMGQAIADSLSAVDYVPFRVTAIGNPAYDLGDVFVFSGGIADETKKYCLMKYLFKYSGNYEMQGVGSNPALANAKSKVEKEMAGVSGGREADKIYFYSYENVEDILIPDGAGQRIVFIRFMTRSLTHVVFRSEVCLSVSGDVTTEGVYYLNNNELWKVHPKEVMSTGEHTLHFLRDMTSGADGRVNTFSLWLEATGGDVTIPAGGIKALLWGQGLVANSEWDGVLECYEDIPPTNFVDVLGICYADSVNVSFIDPTKQGLSDSLKGLNLVNTLGISFMDSGQSPILYERYDVYDGDWIYDANRVKINEKNFVLTDGTISAYLYTPHTTLGYVSAVKSYNTGALFAVSFDEGSTWLKYEDGAWQSSGAAGMDIEMLQGIRPEAWAQAFRGTIQVRAQLTTGNTLMDVEIYGGGYT